VVWLQNHSTVFTGLASK
jgi:hypothetical protein